MPFYFFFLRRVPLLKWTTEKSWYPYANLSKLEDLANKTSKFAGCFCNPKLNGTGTTLTGLFTHGRVHVKGNPFSAKNWDLQLFESESCTYIMLCVFVGGRVPKANRPETVCFDLGPYLVQGPKG